MAPGADELFDRIVVVAAALPEVAIVPDVLADADAEPPAAELEDLRAVERLEVPVLVEDVVGRQERLAKALLDAPVADERRGVEERPAFVGRIRLGQADERRRRPTEVVRASVVERVPASLHEVRAEQQIARQVADQRQLRRDREIGAAVRGRARRLGDQPGVAR